MGTIALRICLPCLLIAALSVGCVSPGQRRAEEARQREIQRRMDMHRQFMEELRKKDAVPPPAK